jgi:WD40 repeat protein
MVRALPQWLVMAWLTLMPGLLAAGESEKDARSKKDLYGDPLPRGAVARLGSVRLRHAALSDLVFLPDDKTIVSAGGDRIFRFWDVITGKQVRTVPLQGTAGPGTCVTLSPDGKTLVSLDQGNLVFWDVNTGKELKKLPNGPGAGGGPFGQSWVAYMYFSPDGETLAVHNEANNVSLWDWANGKERRLSLPAKQPLVGIGMDSTHHGYFSRDGKLFASGAGWFQPLCLWDVATAQEVRRIDCAPTISAFSPDGKLIAAVCMDAQGNNQKSYRLFEVATGKEVFKLPCPPDDSFPWWVEFSPDMETIAWVDSKKISLRERKTGKEIRQIPVQVRMAFFSADGKLLMGNSGNRIRLWEVATGKELHDRPGLTSWPNAIAIAPDGRIVATASWRHNPVNLWDAASGSLLQVLATTGEENEFVQKLSFSPDGKTLFAGKCFGNVSFWDTVSGKRQRTLQLKDPTSPIPDFHPFQAFHLSTDGRRVYTLEHVGTVNQFGLWEADTGNLVKQFAFSPGQQPVWRPDGKTAALLAPDGLSLVDLGTGRTLLHQSGKWQGPLAISPDGRLLAARLVQPSGTYVVWETATLKQVATFSGGSLNGLALAPDNRTLVIADSASLRVWDLATGKELYRATVGDNVDVSFGVPTNETALTLSPDGRRALTSLSDGTLLIWDLTLAPRPFRLLLGEADEKTIETLWLDLAQEAGRAYSAIWKLTETRESAVAFLRGRLMPAVGADFTKVRKLLKDLDDDRFEVRESASRELEKLGPANHGALRQALEAKPSAEVRRRLETLLENAGSIEQSPELLRRLRAIQVLEGIGSEEVRQLLERLASGVSHAPETVAAKEAIDRLARRAASKPKAH